MMHDEGFLDDDEYEEMVIAIDEWGWEEEEEEDLD